MSSNRCFIACGLVLAAALAGMPLAAADPPSGAVSEASPEVSWTVQFLPPNASATCGGPDNSGCDNFLLTIDPPSFPYKVEVTVVPFGVDDWDLEVYTPSGTLQGSSGSGPGSPEIVVLTNPEAGTWTVAVSPYLPTTDASATARIVPLAEGGGNVDIWPGELLNYGPPGASDPGFAPSTGAQGLGLGAGEPSIGIPVANNVALQTSGLPPAYPDPEPYLTRAMFIAYLETLRLTWDDCTDPAAALWEDKSAPLHVASLDPILETDQLSSPSRTHSLQLNAKRSLYAFSDDDGDTWTDSVTGGGINSGVDHQAIGMGPFPAVSPCAAPLHPTATYYASQDIALAQWAISCDGGLTFATANPTWTIAECGGLHGHIEVAPDGAAYLPNKNCSGEQGMAVSTDGTLTSTVKTVPGSTPGESDPAIGIGHDPGAPDDEYTVYFGFHDGSGHPMIAWSDDAGETWSTPVDVGAPFGIQNTAFPAVVAGDRDRAAMAFLGSPDGGNGNTADTNWNGVWHLYIAVTYDHGATWETQVVTPDDPVQRGSVCQQGTTCASNRNLLDFNDLQKDEKGRLLVAWADGCVGSCVYTPGKENNSGTDIARVSRQRLGQRGMYAAFDPEFDPQTPVAPKSPYVVATQFPTLVELAWSTPFDGGSPITEYQIFRRTNSGPFSLLTTVPVDTNTYQDTSIVEGQAYAYQVLAVNGAGTSAACFEAAADVPDVVDPCGIPGARVSADASGDQVGTPALDVETLHIAEPFLDDGAGGSEQKLVFTLKVADGATAAPNNAWIILWNRRHPHPDDTGLQVYDRNMVNMRMTAGGPECHFGKVTAPSVNQGNDLVVLDAADCSLRPDGTITIAADTAVLEDCDPVGSCVIGPGYEINGLEVRTFASNVSGQPVSVASSADSAGGLGYSLFGNDYCGVADVPFEPTALVVDTSRNGVFEAREGPTEVAPSWGNVGDTVATLSGTGSAFHGAGDSIYTIEDGAAAYGSIDAGAQASCAETANCYSLSLTEPSSRPAQHWDTTFDESVSAGADKAWILHIGDSFADMPSTSGFYPYVETIFHHRITAGCNATDYCPAASHARAEMAVFLLKAKDGFGYRPPACVAGEERFADVPAGSIFCPWIEELARRGVTGGCGGGNFCPADAVTRAQMAPFLLKSLEGSSYVPPACTGRFTDVPCPSPIANWIEDLAARGITAGCSADAYCPSRPVTRHEMAVFLTRTFQLVLYGP